MPWGLSRAGEDCNRCRRTLGPDRRAWRGEKTPAVWCEDCAAESGVDGGAPVVIDGLPDGLNKAAIAAAFPDFTAAMRRLRDAAQAKALRGDVSARILGEGEAS